MPKYLRGNPIEYFIAVATNVNALQEGDIRKCSEEDLFAKVFNRTKITYDQYKNPKEKSFQEEIYKTILVGKNGKLDSIMIANSAINQWIKPMYDYLKDYYEGGSTQQLQGLMKTAFDKFDNLCGLTPQNGDRIDSNLSLVQTWVSAMNGATLQALKDKKNKCLEELNILDNGDSTKGNNQNGNNGNQENNQNNGGNNQTQNGTNGQNNNQQNNQQNNNQNGTNGSTT